MRNQGLLRFFNEKRNFSRATRVNYKIIRLFSLEPIFLKTWVLVQEEQATTIQVVLVA